MDQTNFFALLTSFCLIIHTTNSAVNDDVKNLLINFLAKLNGTGSLPDPTFGWSSATDPCQGGWKGIKCDGDSVADITLGGSSLSGFFDAGSLCNVQPLAKFLTKIRLEGNFISGQLPAEVANCKNLTFLLIGNNQFSGNLPDTLSRLSNLKRLDISNNKFSGNLPALSRISGLKIFLAEHNQLTGEIPNFDFSNLERLNISFNNFSGPIPDTKGRFNESNFINNPGLCGPPLPKHCSSSGPDEPASLADDAGEDPRGKSENDALMYSGYVILGLVLIAVLVFRIFKTKKREGLDTESRVDTESKVVSYDDSFNKPSARSSIHKSGANTSEFSADSTDSIFNSSSLLVLTSPIVNGIKFDDLLKAPAELLGRGKRGSLYMVTLDDGIHLAVKRIKDWAISRKGFKQRMHRLSQVKHPNVLSPLAFYSSSQEKLLVYEYQQNGSLLKLIHGIQMGRAFDWASRLVVAATIAEALAFMHQELYDDGIAHGNLKSSNILLDIKMDPCISEYGLMVIDNQESSAIDNVNAFRGTQRPVSSSFDAFQADIYGFGMILLELLTGKLVHTEGTDLASWVQAVVGEEWTSEVFDKSLVLEGANEDRLVNLLRVALQCIDQSPEDRPQMNQVAQMINTLKEEEERSVAMSQETLGTSI